MPSGFQKDLLKSLRTYVTTGPSYFLVLPAGSGAPSHTFSGFAGMGAELPASRSI